MYNNIILPRALGQRWVLAHIIDKSQVIHVKQLLAIVALTLKIVLVDTYNARIIEGLRTRVA